MTDLNDIIGIHASQDAGAELAIRNPITDELTDLKFWIAGPDSNVQKEASKWASAEVAKHPFLTMAPTLPQNEEIRRNIATGLLARCIVKWQVRQNGEPVPLTLANAVRVLNASDIIRNQVDEFAASRQPWRPKTEAPDVAA